MRNTQPPRHQQPLDSAWIDSWLAAEHRGDDCAAEIAFEQVIATLPVPTTRPGFVDRILERAGLDQASRLERRRIWAAISALSLGLGGGGLIVLLRHLGIGELVSYFGQLWIGLGHLLALLSGITSRLVRVGELGRVVATTPELTLGLVVLVLVASLAWASLSALLERSRHVEA